jgi:hypothetical protein
MSRTGTGGPAPAVAYVPGSLLSRNTSAKSHKASTDGSGRRNTFAAGLGTLQTDAGSVPSGPSGAPRLSDPSGRCGGAAPSRPDSSAGTQPASSLLPPPRTTLAQYRRSTASSNGARQSSPGGPGQSGPISRAQLSPDDPHVRHIRPADIVTAALATVMAANDVDSSGSRGRARASDPGGPPGTSPGPQPSNTQHGARSSVSGTPPSHLSPGPPRAGPPHLHPAVARLGGGGGWMTGGASGSGQGSRCGSAGSPGMTSLVSALSRNNSALPGAASTPPCAATASGAGGGGGGGGGVGGAAQGPASFGGAPSGRPTGLQRTGSAAPTPGSGQHSGAGPGSASYRGGGGGGGFERGSAGSVRRSSSRLGGVPAAMMGHSASLGEVGAGERRSNGSAAGLSSRASPPSGRQRHGSQSDPAPAAAGGGGGGPLPASPSRVSRRVDT